MFYVADRAHCKVYCTIQRNAVDRDGGWFILALFRITWEVTMSFAVGVGSSGVCMFHVLILMFILVLICEVL